MTYKQNDYVLFEYGNLIYTGKIEEHFEVTVDLYNISTIYVNWVILVNGTNILCVIERQMSIQEAREIYPEYFI